MNFNQALASPTRGASVKDHKDSSVSLDRQTDGQKSMYKSHHQHVSQTYVEASFRRPTSEFRRPFWDKRPPKDHPTLSQELLDPQKWFTYQNLQNFTRKATRIFSRQLLEIRHV